MKAIIKFYQEETSYQFNAELSKSSVNVFCGTALNRFFEFINCAQKMKAKTFKFNQPINLMVEVDGKKYDTATCNEMLTSKLKLQHNNKSKLQFAKNVFNAVKFSASDVTETAINDVFESFE